MLSSVVSDRRRWGSRSVVCRSEQAGPSRAPGEIPTAEPESAKDAVYSVAGIGVWQQLLAFRLPRIGFSKFSYFSRGTRSIPGFAWTIRIADTRARGRGRGPPQPRFRLL